jgi:hypothetical protein
MVTDGTAFARDPFNKPAQLTVKLSQFHDDGTWLAVPVDATTAKYVPGPPPRIDLQWKAGLAAGRYRLLVEGDHAQPPVDQKMRPLTPLSWARHFRLVANAAGELTLADSLYP